MAHLVRGLTVWVMLPLALTRATGGDGPSCSLAWAPVIRNFSPERGWSAGPRFPFTVTDQEQPDFQAQLFESATDGRTALIIAEWGDPDSAELGSLVYCAVRDREGRVLEEVGRNPLGSGGVRSGCNDPDECA